MPNHVYHTITASTDEGTEILMKMSKHPYGLCGYLLPMPEELRETSSPPRIGDNISEEHYETLKKKYGYADWYSWANNNWGTKWGCYDNEMNGDQYNFTTAWGTFNDDILEKLLEAIPSLYISWEEEQGFGEEIEFVNGERVYFLEWDFPDWSEHIEYDGQDYYYLEKEHKNPMGTFPVGYYADQDLHDPIDDLDLIKKIKEQL